MKHGLAALLAVVDDHAVAVGEASILGHLASRQQELAEEL